MADINNPFINVTSIVDNVLNTLVVGERFVFDTSLNVLKYKDSLGIKPIASQAWVNANKLDLSGGTLTGFLILNADPTAPLGAVTKNYVDNLVTGLTWKSAALVATTTNITLLGEQTIDGVLTSGSRILVKDQTVQTQNGIYVTSSGAWVRSTDADSGSELVGATIYIESGTVNGVTQWNCSNVSVTIGTTNITFVKIAGAGTYTNGTGLSLSGNVFSIDSTVVTLTGSQALSNKTGNISQWTNNSGYLTSSTGVTTVNGASGVVTNIAVTTNNLSDLSSASTARTNLGLGSLSTLNAAPAGTLTGTTLASGVVSSSLTSFGTSPTLVTPNIGIATATSVNKVIITQPATNATLTILNSKTLTINNSLTFAGTDSTIITFQGTDTYVGRTTTDTLTNKTLTSPIINVGSDTTGDIHYRNSSGLFVRLGIGSTNQVLTVISGIPSWQTTTTIPVTSVFGRTGAIIANTGDYTFSQLGSIPTTISGYGITDGVTLTGTQALTNKTLTSPIINLSSDVTGDIYYRNSSGVFSRLGIGSTNQVLTVISGLPSWQTVAIVPVTSVFGRTGAVVATTGDYTFAQISSTPTTLSGYGITDAVNLGGSTMTGLLILSADPTTSLGAATKNYVDNLITGITWKNSVVSATTTNITLSGTQTIDGIAVNIGDRVLVKNQTTQTQNGIYIVASGTWSRSLDADSGSELANATVLSEAGTINGGTQWNCSNTTITIGTTNVIFVQIAGAGVYTNGIGLSLSGNVFSIDSTVVTLTGAQILTNKTLTTPTISSILNSGTITLPTITDTLVGRITTDTLTNKTLTSPVINVSSDSTGDIYYRNSSGLFTRLPIGSSSQVLTGGTIPAWVTFPGITGTATATQISYGIGTNIIGSNSNFTYDSVNNVVMLGTATAFTGVKFQITSTVTSYIQSSIQNLSNNSAASSDMVVTMDTGTDTVGYGDFGINSSTYSQVGFTAQGAGDTYLYSVADGTNIGGNLVIGTASNSKSFKIHTGGTLTSNVRLIIDGSGNTSLIQANQSSTSVALGITQGSHTGGTPYGILFVAGAHTTLVASTEVNDIYFNFSNTKQFSAGNITTQRAMFVTQPVYTAVAASTITDAATVAINGSPIASTNVTITRSYALWVQSGNSRFDGNITSRGVSPIWGTEDTTSVTIQTNNLARTTWDSFGRQNHAMSPTSGNGAAWTFTQSANSGGTTNLFVLNAGAHTTFTASVETIDIYFNLARTVQHSTGNITSQRAFQINAPTYSFVGASTITDAATIAILNAPIAGSNATITRSWGLWLQSSNLRVDGNISSIGVSPSWGTLDANSLSFNTNNITRVALTATGNVTFTQDSQSSSNVFFTVTQAAHTGGTQVGFSFNAGAHTGLSASTEVIDFNINLARTVTISTGALGTQRAIVVQTPTYAFVAASTITDAYTFYINGAPIAGTNATITNTWALGLGGNLKFIGNSRIQSTGNLGNVFASGATYSIVQLGGNNSLAISATTNQTYSMNPLSTGTTPFITYTQPAHTGGAQPGMLWTSGTLTNQTASTEIVDINYQLGRVITWATGAIGTQRSFIILGATLAFAASSTITTAVTLDVTSQTAGANATITNNFAIRSNGNIALSTAGNKLFVKEGTNASSGLVTLAAGTVVVSTTSVTANSRIYLTNNVLGGTAGFLRVSARTANTSFTILSSNAADTSQIAWFIIEPAP